MKNEKKIHEQVAIQPPYLYVLSFAELADRFHFYGLQALIVLYLTTQFKFSDSSSYSLFGIFTALCFAITIVGGIIGDRVLGYHRSIVIGFILLIAANISLSFCTLKGIYLGLALTVVGNGLFKANTASYVGTLYKPNDSRRDGGFSIFYIGMNAGALLGPITYGFIATHYGWNYAFLMSAIILFITFGIFILTKPMLTKMNSSFLESSIKQPQIKNIMKWLSYLTIILAIGGVILLLQLDQLFGSLIEILGVVIVSFISWIVFQSKRDERHTIFALCIIILFCICFFSCSMQTATSLTLFIERQVNRSFGSLQLPTMMFLSLQPLFVILTAPVISKIWTYLSTQKFDLFYGSKITIGLVFASLSFLIFSLAANYTELPYHISLWGIVIGNWFLAIGELCVFPIALAAISQYAPTKWQSTFMGLLFLALSFSGYFAGLIAKIITTHNSDATNSTNYALPFLKIGLFTLIISLIMFFINRVIRRILNNNNVSIVALNL